MGKAPGLGTFLQNPISITLLFPEYNFSTFCLFIFIFFPPKKIGVLSNYFLVNLLCSYNIWLFCQISKSISPYALPEGASSCPQISKFLGYPKW
jgi:hypothetical protein